MLNKLEIFVTVVEEHVNEPRIMVYIDNEILREFGFIKK